MRRKSAAHAVFSRQTLEKFEAASASIPLRQLIRAFEVAAIRPGTDPGGAEGSRKAHFRRYVAGVDQHDPQQRDRLGAALGALIGEVATSKEAFLVQAAERDGFAFANGAFRPAGTAAASFRVTRVAELGSIDDIGHRLQVLAAADPAVAVDGARELVDSVCRMVLDALDAAPSANATDLRRIMESAVQALAGGGTAKARAGDDADALAGRSALRLGTLLADLEPLRDAQRLSPRHARLAVGAALTFARFAADTYAERRQKRG